MVFGPVLACFVLAGSAKAVGVTAPGAVFYIDAAGELVKRDVTLTVPVQGQGEVSLSSAKWSASTTRFLTTKYHGRTVFYVVFDDVGPKHKSLLLRGTYLRGSNLAAYWGDMYTGHCPEGVSLESCAPAQGAGGHRHWDHVGGFHFKAPVTGGTPAPQPAPADVDLTELFGTDFSD
jgi:hypothetical protein